MYRLSEFSLRDTTSLGIALRKAGEGAQSLEDAADRIVERLHRDLSDESGRPAAVLARLFVTVPYQVLEAPLKDFARGLHPDIEQSPGTKCLTLLATRGDVEQWCSRHTSNGHKALPLPSVAAVSRSPMIAQLMRQLGVDLAALLGDGESQPLLVDSEQHSFNVFHVPQALGSPHIPAQEEFVRPYGVQTVLGFGGILPWGELFATILFCRTHVPREVASLFKTLALNAKVALLPFGPTRLFS